MASKNLNDRMCAGLKASAKRLEIRDAKTPGLVFRVTPQEGETWAVVYRRSSDGKRRRITLGHYPTVSLTDAHQSAAEVQALVLRGEDPAGARQAQKAADTFAELAERYMDRHARRTKRSWQEDQRIINSELVPTIGSMKIGEIKRRTLINLLAI